MERPKHHIEHERDRIKTEEDEVTLNSDESFPASDPPSRTEPGPPEPPLQK